MTAEIFLHRDYCRAGVRWLCRQRARHDVIARSSMPSAVKRAAMAKISFNHRHCPMLAQRRGGIGDEVIPMKILSLKARPRSRWRCRPLSTIRSDAWQCRAGQRSQKLAYNGQPEEFRLIIAGMARVRFHFHLICRPVDFKKSLRRAMPSVRRPLSI